MIHPKDMLNKPKKVVFHWSLVATVVCFVAGCGSQTSIQLEPDLPTPLIQSLPLSVGVYYPPELENFEFNEKMKGIGSFKIGLGQTQTHLFRTAFEALFDEVVPIQSFDTQPPGLDLLLVPKIHEVQISVPQQTRTELYEVWLRYSIEMFTPTGQEIHKWGFASYGEVNTQNYQFLSNVSAHALQDASQWAIRDAVATISFFLVKEPKVRNWLNSRYQE